MDGHEIINAPEEVKPALRSYWTAYPKDHAAYRAWLAGLSDADLRAWCRWVFDEARDFLLDHVAERYPERYEQAMTHELERALAEGQEMSRRGIHIR